MENNRAVFELPEGKVWVEVLDAVEREEWQVGTGRFNATYPALKVTTFPGRSFSDAPREFVTHRGRKYSIDNAYQWSHGRWDRENRDNYAQGYQNENRLPVDYKSPVRHTLQGIVDRALEAFVEAHPTWERLSLRLRLERQLKSAESKAARLRGEAQVAEAEAAALRSRLESFRVEV